jgi:hypothetical protein
MFLGCPGPKAGGFCAALFGCAFQMPVVFSAASRARFHTSHGRSLLLDMASIPHTWHGSCRTTVDGTVVPHGCCAVSVAQRQPVTECPKVVSVLVFFGGGGVWKCACVSVRAVLCGGA